MLWACLRFRCFAPGRCRPNDDTYATVDFTVRHGVFGSHNRCRCAKRDAFRSIRTGFGVLFHCPDQPCAVADVNSDVKLLEASVGMFVHHSPPWSWPDMRVEAVWQREKRVSRDGQSMGFGVLKNDRVRREIAPETHQDDNQACPDTAAFTCRRWAATTCKNVVATR